MARIAPYASESIAVDMDIAGEGESTRVQAISRAKEPERIGPYTLYEEIGCGGMATVHLGQLRSASGFIRTVAIKRMHTELARSPEFVAMFFDEARLTGRLQHPNVVPALDCVVCDGTTLLVMDYVHGASLDETLHLASQAGQSIPLPIASAILIGALLGLHAAHEATDDEGKSLGIVHRDVSPHNILIGVDGVARVLDFGIAKAAERAHHTRTGEVKGKLGYMAPEQLFNDDSLGREADVYSVGVILWELLTGRRLFANDSHGQTLMRVANGRIDPPRSVRSDVSPDMEAIAMKALARQPKSRYRTARELAIALEMTCPPAPQRIVGDWLSSIAAEPLRRRWELKRGVDGSRDRTRDTGSSGVRDSVTSRFRQPLMKEATGGQVHAALAQAKPRSRIVTALVIAGVAALSCATGALWSRAPAGKPPIAAAKEAEPRAPQAGADEKPRTPPAPADSPPGVEASRERAPPSEAVVVNPRLAPYRPVFHARSPRAAAGASPSSGQPAAAPTPGPPAGELGAIGGRE